MTDHEPPTVQGFFLEGGQPASLPPRRPGATQSKTAIGTSIKLYLESAAAIVASRFADEEWIPSHLRNPGSTIIASCRDGDVIRFEADHGGGLRVVQTRQFDTVAEATRTLSDGFVRLSGTYPDEPPHGRLTIVKTSGNTHETTPLEEFEFEIEVKEHEDPNDPVLPGRPRRLTRVRSDHGFEVAFRATVDAPNHRDDGTEFKAFGPVRLPVAWSAVEIYVHTDGDAPWNPDIAQTWADLDLALVERDHLRSVLARDRDDPLAGARAYFAKTLEEYERTLHMANREEDLQRYLKDNPSILHPGFAMKWPKLPFGDRISDFVFRNMAGEYLLVELEPASAKLFTKSGNLSARMTHAQGQITDWRRYIEDNLATCQRELGLQGLSSHPKSLIVIGRSSELTDENRAKLRTLQGSNPLDTIWTYDDVLNNAKQVAENLVGPLWLATSPDTSMTQRLIRR